MTQRDRDRLVALKKAKRGAITQRQAAQEARLPRNIESTINPPLTQAP
jgi:hypothetical protein